MAFARSHIYRELVHKRSLAPAFMMLLCLVACGGKSATTSSPAVIPNVAAGTAVAAPSPASSAAPQPVPVKLTYSFAAPATQSSGRRRLQYFSPSNAFLSISVTPLGSTTGAWSTPTACTTVTCVVNFTASPGPNTIAFLFTNAGGVTLASFSTLTIIQPATLNTLAFTANPVVANVALQLAATTTYAGTASDIALTVNATDASLNTIAGPAGYVDSQGNPVVFTLGTLNSQDGGTGTVSIKGPLRITAPAQAPIYAHYDAVGLTIQIFQ